MRHLYGFTGLLLGLGLGWLFGSCSKECPELPSDRSRVASVIEDSTIQIRPRTPVSVDSAAVRVETNGPVIAYVEKRSVFDSGDAADIRDSVRLDTVLTAQEFTMRMDTVTDRGDTVTATASFPPPSMSVAVRPAPDTSYARTRVVVVDRPVPPDEPWYKEPLKAAGYIGAGVLVGYGTRWLTEPDCRTVIVSSPAIRPEYGTRPALVSVNISF